MTRKETENLIAEADSHDGFHVKDVTVGDEHSLHLVFYAGGVPQTPPWQVTGTPEKPYKEIWCKTKPTAADFGDRARTKFFFEAMCRYINTGGSFGEMLQDLNKLRNWGEGSLRFEIPGYHLINSCFNDEGRFEHLFTSDSSQWAIRWVEDEFIDVLSLSELQQELWEAAENEHDTDVIPSDPDDSSASSGHGKALLSDSGGGSVAEVEEGPFGDIS